MALPYFTAFPGIGGVLKERPEDFAVQEIPLYEPSGQGEHVYCEIQKVGITTFDAINRMARALGIAQFDIGFAGMKDARAVTRQTLSIWGTTPEQVMELDIPNITVLSVARHANKLRLGHLKGNRFVVRIRDVTPTDVVKLQGVVDELIQRGMPNYFGEQRFGRRGNNHLLGAALVRGDDEEVLRLLLGDPQVDIDDSNTLGARKAFERNDLDNAMKLFPRRSGMERRILARLIKTKKPAAAVRAVDDKIRRLWVSALQSELFNQVLARRIDSLDRLLPGDLAWKHDSGAVFLVEDPSTEQSRANSFEISPSGPLLGYRMTLPHAEALAIEQAVFQEYQITPQEFRLEGRHKVKGARRPLRVRAEDVELSAGVDEHGGHITVAFTLPPGSFATVLLAELMKNQASDDEAVDAAIPED